MDVDGRLCARDRDNARFGTRPERPYPVTDETVQRMAVRVDGLPPDAMRARVVVNDGRTCIVAVVFVWDDG